MRIEEVLLFQALCRLTLNQTGSTGIIMDELVLFQSHHKVMGPDGIPSGSMRMLIGGKNKKACFYSREVFRI